MYTSSYKNNFDESNLNKGVFFVFQWHPLFMFIGFVFLFGVGMELH